jgi:multidrug transporter EmrE-like cation transporter
MKQFILLFATICCNTVGQLLIKRGMTQVGVITGDLARLPAMALRVVTTPFIILGLVTYVVSAALWLVTLSRLELSLAYPIMSLSYVLIVLCSWLLLGESVSLTRWLGVGVICMGVYFISRS